MSNWRIKLWITYVFFKSGEKKISLSTVLSLLGLTIGVASLVVSMSVVSGYETTLKKTVVDSMGHLLVTQRGHALKHPDELITEIQSQVTGLKSWTPFLYLEALVAHNKKLVGVIVEGVDEQKVQEVLNLKKRMVKGEFEFALKNGVPAAFLGQGLMSKFSLKLGDSFKLVVPTKSSNEAIRPRVQSFYVAGVLNLGRHDFNERYIITRLEDIQPLVSKKEPMSGVRALFQSASQALEAKFKLSSYLGYSYFVQDWRDVNKNLFQAIQVEKLVLFFILLVLVVAACFNIASHLFVNVLKRFRDISILKTLGASRRFILHLFLMHGFLIGVIGTGAGFILGFILCRVLTYIQTQWDIVPEEYKLDVIVLELRWGDSLVIFGATVLICILASMAPAIRGSKLETIEGLKYE